MGVAIPGGHHKVNVTGAKQVGGSVLLAKNNPNACHLYRDMGGVADGNRKKWTFSCWLKRNTLSAGTRQCIFSHGSTSNGEGFIAFGTDDKLYFGNDGHANFVDTDSVYRDTFGWYHIVWAADSSQGSNDDRWKIYVNGILVPASDYGSPSITSNGDGYIQYYNSENMDIAIGERERGIQSGSDDPYPFDGQMCEVYFVDGAQKEVSDFGFTDPLTGSWRPKAYTGTYGTYGWYLPCDGTANVGEDLSGNDLHFRSYNFCGAATIDKATGALPILNTVNGGTVATVGVRTDSDAPGQLVLAIPFSGIATDVSPRINGGTTATPMTVTGAKVASNVTPSLIANNYGDCLYFDGTNDSMWVESDSQVDFGTGDFTIEIWINPTDITHERHLPIIQNGNTAANNYYDWRLYFNNHGYGNSVVWFEAECGGTDITVESKTIINTYVWTHIAVTRESGTFKLYMNGILEDTDSGTSNAIDTDRGTNLELGFNDLGSAGDTFYKGYYQDLRIYKGVAKYKHNFLPGSAFPHILHDSPSGYPRTTELAPKKFGGCVGFGPWVSETGPILTGSASELNITSDTQSFTIEAWINPYAIQPQSPAHDYRYVSILSQGQVYASFGFTDTGVLRWYTYDGTAHYVNSRNNLIQLGTWQHVAVVSNSGAIKLYHNGLQVASGTLQDPSGGQSDGIHIGNADLSFQSDAYLGFISNLRVTSTAVYTSEFTPSSEPLTNITGTKLLCCQDPESATAAAVATGALSAAGHVSPNPNNPFDTNINTVQGESSNYATINDNEPWYNLTIARGALRVYSSSSDRHVRASFRMPEWGKWYWEMQAGTVAAAGYLATGLYYRTGSLGASAIATAQGRWITASGNKGGQGGNAVSYGGGYDDGDYVSIAVDMDAGKIFAAINGVWCEASNPVTGANAMYDDLRTAYSDMAWFPVCCQWQAGNVGFFNFGQRPFRYTPPKGYQPLSANALGAQKNTANMEPGIPRPDKYFKVDDYAGTGATQRITGLNFQPDLVMLKKFSGGSDRSWQTYDAVRGATILMHNDSNNNDQTQGAGLTAFNRDGFTLSTDDGCNGSTSSPKYMYYCWKAGGGGGTTGGEFWKDDIKYASAAAAGMDGGDITPTGVSVGTKQGFSIVGYTGNGSNNQTISHGLGRTPALCIVKNRDEDVEWIVKHKMNTSNKIFYMDLTDGEDGATGSNHGIPADFSGTSTITLKTSSSNYNNVNKNSVKYIMYTWAEIPGFSSFGEYTGNDNDIGININIGFRPELLIIKKKSASENWCVMHNDTAMNDFATGSNCDHHLRFDNNSMDNTPGGSPPVSIDLLAQGFVHKDNSPQVNDTGTFVYMAWAKSPLNNLYGGQVIAR